MKQPAIRARVLDGSNAVALATRAAADDLTALSLQPELRIRERHLADAIGEHLGATVERRVPVPGWDPQPGNVDVFTADEQGRPLVVVETKLKAENSIFECLWDMAKVLSLATAESNRGAYIVCGTTMANWHKPIACAELFETGRHGLVAAIEHNAGWWDKYILGDSTGRPAAVAASMGVVLVAAVELPIRGEPWELRTIRVSDGDPGSWRPFVDGRPVPAA